MLIGVPKEIKIHEYRVGIIPPGVSELKRDGHEVLAETGAGEGSGFSDNDYRSSGAKVVSREEIFDQAELIIKVKEPLPSEYHLLKEGQTIFTFLHLASNRVLTEMLSRKRVTALGYETLQRGNTLPLLSPMSEIAGRMAPIMGAFYLQRCHGGTGILPSGAIGVKPAKALILGAGVVGMNAARVSYGLGMHTVVLNRGVERLQRIDEVFMGGVRTLALTNTNILAEMRDADMVIGAVLIPGAKPPLLISRNMLNEMRKGAVIVDVSIDQGGCVETSRPTTHDDPVYDVDGITHYAVANMPGAYPRTSTLALTNATLPYIRTIAAGNLKDIIQSDKSICSAVNIFGGEIVNKALAVSLNLPYRPLDKALS